LGEDSRSLLESDALFVEQGTERIKAKGKREEGEKSRKMRKMKEEGKNEE